GYGPAIGLDDDVADLQACGLAGAARLEIADHEAEGAGQPQALGEHGRDGLDGDADRSPVDVPLLAEAVVDETDEGCREREPQPFVAAGLAQDEGADADQL